MLRHWSVLLLVLATVAPAAALDGPELQPRMLGWERHFAVTFGPGEYRGAPVVEGWVENISPYNMRRVQILVDTLDAAGQVTAQRLAFVPGDLAGGGRLFFQVPAAPAPAYRVRVFSYDRFEAPHDLR